LFGCSFEQISNKLNQSKSAPPEVLKLKCGARVVITRNIDVAGGVVNGTIGTIENIQPNLITVQRLNDNELMCNTRIRHYVSLHHSTDVAIREVSFNSGLVAITVHRVQGMTVSSNVLVVLDSTFFASGQAYVALSRVKKSTQLHLLAFYPDNVIEMLWSM
jgi:ATP-dependent DNA helicase PIF1